MGRSQPQQDFPAQPARSYGRYAQRAVFRGIAYSALEGRSACPVNLASNRRCGYKAKESPSAASASAWICINTNSAERPNP